MSSKITDLTDLTSLAAGDKLVVVDVSDTSMAGTGTNKKVTVANFATNTHGMFNVKAYGAVGDGSTDDAAAIQAVIDAVEAVGGGVVFFPKGVYAVGTALTVTESVSFLGVGNTASNLDTDSASTYANSMILWTGGASPVFTFNNGSRQLGGLSIRDLAIDGATTATIGIKWDRVCHSQMDNVRIVRCATNCFWLGTSASGTHENSQANTFTNLSLERAPTPLLLSGNGGATANACHNVFLRLFIDFSGNEGIDLVDCDNNLFQQVWCYRRTGSGYGVRFRADARANYFYDLESGDDGVYVHAPTFRSNSNVILGYDRENGQAAPTLETGANLTWTEDGRSAGGWKLVGRSVKLGVCNASPTTRLDVNGTIHGCGIYSTGLGSPSAPTVTNVGTAGSTTYAYKITATSSTGETLPSSATSTTTGNATLNGSNFNRITWNPVAGAVNYKVYRTTSAGSPGTTGLIGTVADTAALTLDDTGLSASTAAPTTDTSFHVGIGTATPSYPFHVIPSTGNAYARVESVESATEALVIVGSILTQWGGYQFYGNGTFQWQIGNRGGTAGDFNLYLGSGGTHTFNVDTATGGFKLMRAGAKLTLPGSTSGFTTLGGDAVAAGALLLPPMTGFIPGILFTQTASVSATNTTELTLVGSGVGTQTIPANLLVIGRTIRVRASGYMSTHSTAGTWTIRLRYGTATGGTILATTGAVTPTASMTHRHWEVLTDFTCRTTGASGTIFSKGAFKHAIAAPGLATSLTTWPMDQNSAPPTTVTLDTTAATALHLTITLSNNNANNTITCTNLSFEILN